MEEVMHFPAIPPLNSQLCGQLEPLSHPLLSILASSFWLAQWKESACRARGKPGANVCFPCQAGGGPLRSMVHGSAAVKSTSRVPMCTPGPSAVRGPEGWQARHWWPAGEGDTPSSDWITPCSTSYCTLTLLLQRPGWGPKSKCCGSWCHWRCWAQSRASSASETSVSMSGERAHLRGVSLQVGERRVLPKSQSLCLVMIRFLWGAAGMKCFTW